MLLLNAQMSGLLDDALLPAADFAIFQNQPYSHWPEELKQRLAPFGTDAIAAADAASES